MPLSNFAVVRDHVFAPGQILINCFDGPQVVLVFVSREIIDEYFRRNDLTREQRDLLVDRNLPDLALVINDKYDRGLVGSYASGTQRFPRIEITLDDLRSVPGGLTANVLDIAARAGLMNQSLRGSLTDVRLIPEYQQLTGSVVLTCTDGAEPQIEVLIRRRHLDDIVRGRGWGGPLKSSGENDLVEANLGTLTPIIQAKYDDGGIALHTSLVSDKPMRLIALERSDLERGITRSSELAVATQVAERTAEEIRRIPPSAVPNAVSFDGGLREEPKRPDKKRPPKSVAQRPAAYRFTTADDKIDVLPEQAAPLNRQLAEDTQQELLRKARELLARLQGSNSAQRVCDSVEGLLDALDVPFDELRPGLLLSRVRSLEADGSAFDTEDARAELFSDAFARVADAVNTARDLLGVFPEVRRVEVERIALGLHRHPDVLPSIEQQASEIEEAAQKTKAATEDAVQALARNDTAINAAADPVLRNELVADKLLVTGNFARAVAEKAWSTELVGLGADGWQAVRENLPAGIGVAARVAPLMALMALAVLIVGPVAGIAATVPAWKPFSGVLKKLVRDSFKAGEVNTPPRRARAERRGWITKSQADLEEMVLAEARKTPQGALLDVVKIKPGRRADSWEIEAWGSRRHGGPLLGCEELLRHIAAQLGKSYKMTRKNSC